MTRPLLNKLSPVLLACACAAGLGINAQAQRVPIGTNEVSFVDFDLSNLNSSYGYFYSDGNIGGGYFVDRFYLVPPDSTNMVLHYTFDDAVFTGFTSWWGTGFGGVMPWSQDPLVFNSTDLTDYILSFDARVEGLAPGTNTANCVMEFRLGLGGTQWSLVRELPYAPGSNWAHFVFTLDQGKFIAADGTSTSMETWTNGVAAGITTVAFNQNQPNPIHFGFDTDNVIELDNVKLQLLQYAGPPPPPPPKVGLAILDYNFDDKGLWWVWPNYPETTTGWSANANKGSYWGLNPVVGGGLDGSQAMAIGMDNTLIAVAPPGIPDWAGGNASAGGEANLANLTGTALGDYRVTLNARAAGLADEINGTTSFVLQLIFNSPDDTLQPPDADTGADMLLRLNGQINNVKSNWQAFSMSLKDFGLDSGSMANFTNNLSKVSEIQFQLQIQNPHTLSTWGTDADNQIIIDDLKLERLVIGTPPLMLEIVGTGLKLTWAQPSSGAVKLMSGNTPDAITTEVVGATSPYNLPLTGAAKFYRTQWVPPTP